MNLLDAKMTHRLTDWQVELIKKMTRLCKNYQEQKTKQAAKVNEKCLGLIDNLWQQTLRHNLKLTNQGSTHLLSREANLCLA
jgi:hypothetical protein